MYQRASHKMGACFVQNTAHLAVLPLLLSKRRGLPILTFLLFVTAIHGNPITTTPDTYGDLPTELSLTVVSETAKTAVQARFAFPLLTSDTIASGEEWLPPELNRDSTNAQEAPGHECYPYLLLTGGLILLAFRPAHPALTGRS